MRETSMSDSRHQRCTRSVGVYDAFKLCRGSRRWQEPDFCFSNSLTSLSAWITTLAGQLLGMPLRGSGWMRGGHGRRFLYPSACPQQPALDLNRLADTVWRLGGFLCNNRELWDRSGVMSTHGGGRNFTSTRARILSWWAHSVDSTRAQATESVRLACEPNLSVAVSPG
jgi:hypothetical protein